MEAGLFESTSGRLGRRGSIQVVGQVFNLLGLLPIQPFIEFRKLIRLIRPILEDRIDQTDERRTVDQLPSQADCHVDHLEILNSTIASDQRDHARNDRTQDRVQQQNNQTPHRGVGGDAGSLSKDRHHHQANGTGQHRVIHSSALLPVVFIPTVTHS